MIEKLLQTNQVNYLYNFYYNISWNIIKKIDRKMESAEKKYEAKLYAWLAYQLCSAYPEDKDNLKKIKYFCGGRCRGETFQETGDVMAPYPYCDEWKKAMEKIFWILTEYPQWGDKKYLEISNKVGRYLNLWH